MVVQYDIGVLFDIRSCVRASSHIYFSNLLSPHVSLKKVDCGIVVKGAPRCEVTWSRLVCASPEVRRNSFTKARLKVQKACASSQASWVVIVKNFTIQLFLAIIFFRILILSQLYGFGDWGPWKTHDIPHARAWSSTSLGLFSIKTFFMVLSTMLDIVPFSLANFIWKSKVPSKVKTFTWLVAYKKVNTNNILQLRRPLIP